MRPTDKVLEEEFFFCLRLFSVATDRQSFGRRSFFLNLFSCATDGQGFGRSLFLDLFSGATDGQGFGRRSFFLIYLVVRPTDKVLEEEVFFEFI